MPLLKELIGVYPGRQTQHKTPSERSRPYRNAASPLLSGRPRAQAKGLKQASQGGERSTSDTLGTRGRAFAPQQGQANLATQTCRAPFGAGPSSRIIPRAASAPR